MDLCTLTSQEEQYVLLRCRGLTPEAAATAVGLPADAQSLYSLHENKPAIDGALVAMRDKVRRVSIMAGVRVNFSRDDAALLYLEAHAKSANATEEIKAVEGLVKLFGLQEPEKKELRIRSRADLQEMDDSELARMACQDIPLDPSEYTTSDE